jgi:hypothetical protein
MYNESSQQILGCCYSAASPEHRIRSIHVLRRVLSSFVCMDMVLHSGDQWENVGRDGRGVP